MANTVVAPWLAKPTQPVSSSVQPTSQVTPAKISGKTAVAPWLQPQQTTTTPVAPAATKQTTTKLQTNYNTGLLGLINKAGNAITNSTFGSRMSKIGQAQVDTYKNTFNDAVDRAGKAADSLGKGASGTQRTAAIGELAMGVANVLFSPISATFAAGGQTPGVNQATSGYQNLIQYPIAGTQAVFNAILSHSGLSKDQVKTLTPLSDEVAQWVPQILVAKAAAGGAGLAKDAINAPVNDMARITLNSAIQDANANPGKIPVTNESPLSIPVKVNGSFVPKGESLPTQGLDKLSPEAQTFIKALDSAANAQGEGGGIQGDAVKPLNLPTLSPSAAKEVQTYLRGMEYQTPQVPETTTQSPLPNGVPSGTTKEGARVIAQSLFPGEAPKGDTTLGVVKTLQESAKTTNGLKDIVGSYNIKPNAESLAQAKAKIAADPVAAHTFALSDHGPVENTTAVLLAKHYEAVGQVEAAKSLMVEKAQQALKAGQGNQIYAMWDKMSPELIGKTVQGMIDKYNESARTKIPQLSTEKYQEFVSRAKQVQALPEGSKIRDMALQKLMKDIGKEIPSSTGDKVFAAWRAGLLTGFRTPGKIILSHTGSNLGTFLAKIPGKVADVAQELVTGRSAMTVTPKGIIGGFGQGIRDAVDNFIHDYNRPSSGGVQKDFFNQVNYGDTKVGKAMQTYVDTIGRLHGSLYKPFYGSIHLNSIMDQALTAAKNLKVAATDKANFVTDFVKKATDYAVKNPDAINKADFKLDTPERAAVTANAEAQKATFQNKTKLSEIASSMKRGSGNPTKYVAPFTQIPSSITMQLFDYSPVGIVKEIVTQLAKGEYDQRAISEAFGKSVVGTTGMMAIGGALQKAGLITFAYPKDKGQQALWKLEGKTAWSVNIGGKWRSLASFGPAGDAVAVGAAIIDGYRSGGITQASLEGTLSGLDVIASSPYLQGIETIGQGLADPQGQALGVAKSYLGSTVPTGIANIATATDPLQRQVDNITAILKSKIPGLRETLPAQINIQGQEVQRSNNVIGSLLDPNYSSKNLSSSVTKMLDGAGYSPAAPDIKLSINLGTKTVTYSLKGAEKEQYLKDIGKATSAGLTALSKAPDFNKLPQQVQQTIISNLVTQVRAPIEQMYKIKYFSKMK